MLRYSVHKHCLNTSMYYVLKFKMFHNWFKNYFSATRLRYAQLRFTLNILWKFYKNPTDGNWDIVFTRNYYINYKYESWNGHLSYIFYWNTKRRIYAQLGLISIIHVEFYAIPTYGCWEIVFTKTVILPRTLRSVRS